ncbi:hypothetical protein [Microbacterium sp. Root61]|uniref:hypothetical protein n=1 Tax=Microbacterium sp. Root61 TaxID=1736570 RepID=UPI000B1C2105|nr:hypothetical protein [Microbacterium sp. Root61]
MTTISRRLLAVSAAIGLAAFALAGCATPAGAPNSSGAPSAPVVGDTELDAAWLDDGRAVGIVTQGSSTCVPTAGEPTYDAATATLTVELTDPEGAACTRDLVPRASLVSLPAGVDPTKDLEIVVTGTYAGDTDLDGDPGLTGKAGDMTEYLPSAGWFDDGGFLILSWGSSSCVPVLEDVVATTPLEVTATFQTPAADQVCTADMAPRVTVAGVTGVDDDFDVQLILTGGEFDNIKVRIAGES